MGDGPAYDYAYARASAHLVEKRARQRKRLAKLLDLMHTEGFGESDGDNSLVEAEVARHLRMAYDLLSLVVRD